MTANTKNKLSIIIVLAIAYGFTAIVMAHNMGYM